MKSLARKLRWAEAQSNVEAARELLAKYEINIALPDSHIPPLSDEESAIWEELLKQIK